MWCVGVCVRLVGVVLGFGFVLCVWWFAGGLLGVGVFAFRGLVVMFIVGLVVRVLLGV